MRHLLRGRVFLSCAFSLVSIGNGFRVADTTASIRTLSGRRESSLCQTDSESLHYSPVFMEPTTMKSWRALLEVSVAKSRKIRGSNYVQLATVENGEPRCRTVVFRGFQRLPQEHPHCNVVSTETSDALSCTFKMCTDARSQKVPQASAQPIAEIVWWFPKSSEQYRVRGILRMIGPDEAKEDDTYRVARKELWGNLSDPARESFLSVQHPGQPWVDPASLAPTPPGGRDESGSVVPPPDNFLLMLLDPTDVDYLCLTGSQHRQIDKRETDHGWSSQLVNP